MSSSAQWGRGRNGAAAWTMAMAMACTALGCTVPIAQGLEEGEANQIAVALEQAGVGARKQADPQTEGRFLVEVAQDDAATALQVMRDEELPRQKPRGVLDSVGQGALVPSRTAEHAQYVSGLAGDLEASLLQLDGVLSARVHLQVPTPDPLRNAPPEPATASVLVTHRGSTPPLADAAIAKLVAGGVAGLQAERVDIVQVARAARAESAAGRLKHVGPLAVSESSAKPLQFTLGALILLALVQAAIMLALVMKLSRARSSALPPPRPS